MKRLTVIEWFLGIAVLVAVVTTAGLASGRITMDDVYWPCLHGYDNSPDCTRYLLNKRLREGK